MAEAPAWERIQVKTFTKWCNSHLKKEFGAETKVNDILADWENGILLMKLATSLYKENEKHPEQAISMPKLKDRELNAKTQIAMVQNCNKALSMLKTAGVRLASVSAEDLLMKDKAKVAILGMIWMIILDYAARGFGGSSSEVKRALLEWVNKKTDGYERVNPPGVKNFTKDWRSGLAWCALIHAHRPHLIDYEKCLTQTNAENLEQAFSVAENDLDIPRLLDVEDVDTTSPDDKSIMTYVMEYFHRFASEGLKDSAAKQAAEWLDFLRQIMSLQNDYERRARLLLEWGESAKQSWEGYNFGDTSEEAKQAFDELRTFVTETKPVQAGEKMDLEALFAEIQTILKVNNLSAYTPPEDVTPESLQDAFSKVSEAQDTHATHVRENRFRFIEKKEDNSSEEIEKQISDSFTSFDANNNGSLNKTEFEAACMKMCVGAKSQDEKDKLFQMVAQGDETVSKEEYAKWMRSRLVVNLGDAAGVKAAFAIIADGNTNAISMNQLSHQPLSDEHRAFLSERMQKNEDGTLNYSQFVDDVMNSGNRRSVV